ncbi:MAG: CHAD domain-containing protein [Caulobacterales bacterium]
MPYRFRLKEPLDDGAQRIAREQLERAIKAFEDGAPTDLAIHGARRRLKKVRALLRLIRPGLGGKTYKHWNSDLRDTGVLFSDARDAIVMAAAADSLAEKAPARAKQAIAAVQRLMVAAQVQAGPDERNNAVSAGIERIRAAASDVENLRCGGLSIQDLGEGAAMGLEQSKDAFAHAFKAEDDESFHEWRKSVQRHWRHMQLLHAAWPEFFDVRANLAQDIARLLGDDHDLSILKTFAAERIGAGLTEKQAGVVFDFAQKRQDKLRAKAKVLGGALLAATPKALAQETEAYWEMSKDKKADQPPHQDDLGGGADAIEEEIAEANRPDSPLIQQ